MNLNLQTNFLDLVPSFELFCQGLITSNFNQITLLSDVNIAVNITQITPVEQNDSALINIYNTVSNQNTASGK